MSETHEPPRNTSKTTGAVTLRHLDEKLHHAGYHNMCIDGDTIAEVIRAAIDDIEIRRSYSDSLARQCAKLREELDALKAEFAKVVKPMTPSEPAPARGHTAPCPHGIPHEERKRDGCRKCDDDSVTALVAEQDARAFRARVIQTARAVLPSCVALCGAAHESKQVVEVSFLVAEAFERAADEYLKGDKP